MLWTLLLAGCAQRDVAPAPSEPPLDHAVRASMALRGVRPSPEELATLRRDPGALPQLVDRWLEDPLFGKTVRSMVDEVWLLSSGVASVPINGTLAGHQPVEIRNSLAEALPRLVEHVVTEDRPYTEIVTADYTLADEIVAAAWTGMGPYDPAGPDWQVTTWADDRPHAGVLSDSYFYVAYRSAGANYNRSRANQLARVLLCRNFLQADPIPDTSIDLSDPDVVKDAVVNNPSCAVCHEDLDPLASFLAMRPYPVLVTETWPLMMYSPLYEDLWQDATGRAPAYFGEPGADMADLGRFIAEDPSFASCTSRRFLSFLEQTPLEQVDSARADALTESFVSSGYLARKLVREIVLSEEFANPDHALVARPHQLSSQFLDWTGLRWQTDSEVECCEATTGRAPYGRVPDLLEDPYVGWRVLAGGVDSPHVALPMHTVNPTYQVVLRTYALLGADEVVQHDLVQRAIPARLLDRAIAETEDEQKIRAQLVSLHERLYAEQLAPDDPEIDDTWALFVAARDHHDGDATSAWRVTLTAMLQDIRVATY
jgi:hypothetical protein